MLVSSMKADLSNSSSTCRLKVEQVTVKESSGGPLVLDLRSLRILSASWHLFSI